jgi:hypothetical protein
MAKPTLPSSTYAILLHLKTRIGGLAEQSFIPTPWPELVGSVSSTSCENIDLAEGRRGRWSSAPDLYLKWYPLPDLILHSHQFIS